MTGGFDLDLRLSQELPGPGRFFGIEDKIELFADFDNFLNILDSSWNVFRNRGGLVDVVDGGVDAAGRYVISGFNPDDQNRVGFSSSVWRIQIGATLPFLIRQLRANRKGRGRWLRPFSMRTAECFLFVDTIIQPIAFDGADAGGDGVAITADEAASAVDGAFFWGRAMLRLSARLRSVLGRARICRNNAARLLRRHRYRCQSRRH